MFNSFILPKYIWQASGLQTSVSSEITVALISKITDAVCYLKHYILLILLTAEINQSIPFKYDESQIFGVYYSEMKIMFAYFFFITVRAFSINRKKQDFETHYYVLMSLLTLRRSVGRHLPHAGAPLFCTLSNFSLWPLRDMVVDQSGTLGI